MASVSSAGLFFERILRERAAFLRSLVDSREQETERLEFKGGEHLDDAEIRTNWSRALCGFASNEGGVLVWGIDARQDPATRVDAASAVSLVANPEALLSRLSQLLPTAADPPILGVRSEAVYDNGTDGPGFVASYIPESATKPHRAELLQNKPYIIRIGGSFINPSPSILRNLFYPRSSARLRVDVQPKWQPIESEIDPSEIAVDYHVWLHNAGLVSASEIFVVVQMQPFSPGLHLPYGVVKRTTHHDGLGLALSRNIHPSSVEELCVIRQQAPVVRQIDGRGIRFTPMVETTKFLFRIFATDTAPTQLEIILTDWDIQMQTAKAGQPRPATSAGE